MGTHPLSNDRPICIAILAIGGQGGGVLADWIVTTAELNGWYAQATSVPGVAQRTGATVYYLEVLPNRGRPPVLALMPTPGDVDIVLAAELMEAGRAILRGFCAPERTRLVCSTHRSYSISEKSQPGNGIIDPTRIIAAIRRETSKVIALDMASIADRHGTVISAPMLGALAASGALPYTRASFEEAIKRGGVGVSESLQAFAHAYADTEAGVDGLAALENAIATGENRAPPSSRTNDAPTLQIPMLADVVAEALHQFPEPTHVMLAAGIRRVADYQDLRYVAEYLEKVRQVLASDRNAGGEHHGFALTTEAARQIAVGMAYDDVIRVADLKIRSNRFERIRREVGRKDSQLVYTTEFMHPRVGEVLGTLPRRLGAWIEGRPHLCAVLERVFNKGRRIQTSKLGGFLTLYVIAGIRRFRRHTLRHHREMERLAHWLEQVHSTVAIDYRLAVEIVKNRRLVKGYSDTHERGERKFNRVMDAAARLVGRGDAAMWVQKLRNAALADEEGAALEEALRASPVKYE
jgi:indolepyruvate ferredoxin oxidoreductase beta subunit